MMSTETYSPTWSLYTGLTVVNSFILLAYASLATLLQRLLACLNLNLELVQMKKVISRNYGSNTSSWKPWRWVRLDLIFSMRDIYINSNPNPLTKFPSSSRSTKFKDILPSNISQMITKTIPINTRIVTTYVMKRSINMIRISQWREGHCRTNTSVRRKKEIQKSRTMRITVWDLSRKVKHLSKAIWDRKIITGFNRLIISTRIVKPGLMVDVKSQKTKTLGDGLIERTSSVLDEIELKTVQKDEEGDW